MLKKLAQKVGFTLLELRVILFLILAFVIGLLAKELINPNVKVHYRKFDYTFEDSLFNTANFNDSVKKTKVDYKQEVLDFKKTKFTSYKRKLPAKKSIDINQANKSKLVLLPGIGKKTAERIISYRRLSGGFKNLAEVKKVKGIGNKKFNKIKKYIYIK